MVGFLGVIKPSGISSASLLNEIKRVLRQNGNKSSIGHMGTLDLEASGVLVVAIGKATRLFNYFLEKGKTYETVFQFGVETDTLDASGNVLKETKVIPSEAQIKNVLSKFVGKQMQMPPIFSAKKVGGECAYLKARRNEEVALKAKEIEIFSFKLIEKIDKTNFKFEIVCSSGTYIRSIARDLAQKLGSLAVAREINRTKCGFFSFENCIRKQNFSYEDITKKIVNPEKILNWIETIKISSKDFKDLLDGKEILCGNSDGIYFAKSEKNDNMLVSVKQNKMKIRVNLKE